MYYSLYFNDLIVVLRQSQAPCSRRSRKTQNVDEHAGNGANAADVCSIDEWLLMFSKVPMILKTLELLIFICLLRSVHFCIALTHSGCLPT